jgi:anti-sigma regulatory factor (Ser/Thr protein kinase)
LAAGAFYYLSKPFDQAALIAMLKTALRDTAQHKRLQRRLNDTDKYPEQDLYRFRTPDDAGALAIHLARRSGDPERVVGGLFELLINAVEHGNLGLGYEEKTRLMDSGRWWDEMNERIRMQKFAGRYATVKVTYAPDQISYLIKDQGDGFDHRAYLQIEPQRASHSHGRGITFARMSFDELQYRGAGNEVLAVVKNPIKANATEQ